MTNLRSCSVGSEAGQQYERPRFLQTFGGGLRPNAVQPLRATNPTFSKAQALRRKICSWPLTQPNNMPANLGAVCVHQIKNKLKPLNCPSLRSPSSLVLHLFTSFSLVLRIIRFASPYCLSMNRNPSDANGLHGFTGFVGREDGGPSSAVGGKYKAPPLPHLHRPKS